MRNLAAALMPACFGLALAFAANADDAPRTAGAAPAPGTAAAPSVAPTTGVVGPPSVAATPAAPDSARAMPSTLTVFNRPVTVFRSTFLGAPPLERTLVARERVHSVLERGGPGKVGIEAIPQGRMITIDGAFIFILTPNDAGAVAGETLDTTAAATASALERAIAETREARDGQLMTRAAIHAAIATAIFLLVIGVLLRIGRVLTRRMLRLVHESSDRLRVGGGTIVQRHRAVRFVNFALRGGAWFLFLLVTYEWLGFVLGRFPYTRAWSEQLNGFLLDSVTDMLVAVAHATPDLMVAIVVFVVARLLDRLQRGFFDSVQAGRVHVGWVDQDTAPPSKRMASLVIWLFAAVMAYPYIPGSSTDAFKGLTVLLGLMVSVGASSLVGQAASGLILMYTRTYRRGDYVNIGEAEGTIVAMTLFTTRLRTGMGDEVTLPNATVLGSVTRNFSRAIPGEGFTVATNVSIGYDVPWRQVQAMLFAAAGRIPGVLADPTPRVFQTRLADFYVEYRLACRAATSDPLQRAELLSSLNGAILDVFNEHGVQIMSPHYLGDPSTPKVVPRAAWFTAPATPPEGKS